MDRKKEPCRNFLRGSCRYGNQCKFLHVSQPPTKPNPFGFGATNQQQQRPNPFGFGVNTTSLSPSAANSGADQQQKPNHFGFGVQSSSHFTNTANLGVNGRQNPNPFGFGAPGGSQLNSGNRSQSPAKFQPFENKWVRPTNTAQSPQSSSEQQAVTHDCSDPESCKRQFIEDSMNEAPLWKLTCYGHWKYLPCDVSGDVSYEELRALAYEDGRLGSSIQSIIERERSLLKSKLLEFENLLRIPVRHAQTPALSRTNLSGINFSPEILNPPFSTFLQPGTFNTIGSTIQNPPPHVNSSGVVPNLGKEDVVVPSGKLTTQNFSNFGLGGTTPGSNCHLAPSKGQEASSRNYSIWMKESWEFGEFPEEEPPEEVCL